MRSVLAITLCFIASWVRADGTFVDKVYHPYVQPLEREIELRFSADSDHRNTVRLGLGRSFGERWFGELYLIGEDARDDSFDLQTVELEALWQMTDQGEYFADWGMLFELERSLVLDITEVSAAVLIEKQWGRWVGAANLYGIYEFGGDIDNELETAAALQLRYRHSRSLEPAIELYKAENVFGVGPVFMGSEPFGAGRRLRWEAGVIFGFNDRSAGTVLKALLEYEF